MTDDWEHDLRELVTSARPSTAMAAPVLARVERGIRRRRRMAVSGVVVATVLAVAVGVGAREVVGAGDGTNGLAPSGPAASDLSVEVAAYDGPPARGVASWDEADDTVVYVLRSGYSSSCSARGTATSSASGSVALEIVRGTGGERGMCSADDASHVATISGLGEQPAELVVTEDGRERVVPVVGRAPTAPEGQRLVGRGRVVISVPESWGTEETRCGQPTTDTVFFVPDGFECLTEAPGISAVLVVGVDDDLASYADTPDTVNGIDVLRGNPSCPAGASCVGLPEAVLVVPGEDVAFVIPEGADGGEVLDSVQLLPAGLTTVPFLAYGNTRGAAETFYRAAGFDVRVAERACPPNANCFSGLVGVDPVPGTVLPVGSTVTLEVLT